jgi:hypothetical protein
VRVDHLVHPGSAQVNPTETHGPLVGIVEVHEQAGQRRLATARPADEPAHAVYIPSLEEMYVRVVDGWQRMCR